MLRFRGVKKTMQDHFEKADPYKCNIPENWYKLMVQPLVLVVFLKELGQLSFFYVEVIDQWSFQQNPVPSIAVNIT